MGKYDEAPMLETLLAQYKQLLVRPRTAEVILDVGTTTIWKLIKLKELDTVYIGSGRRITVESLNRYVEKLKAAKPASCRKSLDGATIASLRSRQHKAQVRAGSAPTPVAAKHRKATAGEPPDARPNRSRSGEAAE
jgi:hypothetical protein